MWVKSENSTASMPDAVEKSGNYVIVRKNFVLVEGTEDIPAHYQYDEWQMTAEQYEVYQDFEQQISEQAEQSSILTECILEMSEIIYGE